MGNYNSKMKSYVHNKTVMKSHGYSRSTDIKPGILAGAVSQNESPVNRLFAD